MLPLGLPKEQPEMDEEINYKQKYEELKAAVLDMYRTRHPGSRKMPYVWAIRDAKKNNHKLMVLVDLLKENKVE